MTIALDDQDVEGRQLLTQLQGQGQPCQPPTHHHDIGVQAIHSL